MKHALVTYGPFVLVMLALIAANKRGMLSFLDPAAPKVS